MDDQQREFQRRLVRWLVDVAMNEEMVTVVADEPEAADPVSSTHEQAPSEGNQVEELASYGSEPFKALR